MKFSTSVFGILNNLREDIAKYHKVNSRKLFKKSKYAKEYVTLALKIEKTHHEFFYTYLKAKMCLHPFYKFKKNYKNATKILEKLYEKYKKKLNVFV